MNYQDRLLIKNLCFTENSDSLINDILMLDQFVESNEDFFNGRKTTNGHQIPLSTVNSANFLRIEDIVDCICALEQLLNNNSTVFEKLASIIFELKEYKRE